MNRLLGLAMLLCGCFISSMNGDHIGKGEARRTGAGATAALLVYSAVELLRHKEGK